MQIENLKFGFSYITFSLIIFSNFILNDSSLNASDLLTSKISVPASSVVKGESFKTKFDISNINIFDAQANEWHVVVKILDNNELEVFDEIVPGVFLPKGSSSNPTTVTLETSQSFTPNTIGNHTVSVDVNYSQDINTGNDKMSKIFSVIDPPSFTISGNVREDVNYGGNRGYFEGIPRPNVIMELYSSGGIFIRSTATENDGSYSFTNLLAGNYTVRATNYSVTSSRPRNSGAEGNPIPVQTYRTDASTGTPSNVNDKVGGEVPSKIDANLNNGSQTLLSLTTSTSTPQSMTIVKITNKDVGGINFVFNFSTIVNTNSEGQGSLRQFIINSNTLSNNGLAQSGQTAGTESSIFMIPSSSDPLSRPADPNFNGMTFNIMPTSELPPITDKIKLDGFIQTVLSGDTNPNRPEILLDGLMAGETSTGISFLITDCRLTGMIIQKFGANGIFCNSKIYLGTVGESSKSVECLLNGLHGIQSKSADYVGNERLILHENFSDGARIDEVFEVDGIWARENSGWGVYFGDVFRIRRDVGNRATFRHNGKGGVSGLNGLFSGRYVISSNNGDQAGDGNVNEGHGIIAKNIVVYGAGASNNRKDGFRAETLKHKKVFGNERLSADNNGGDGIYVTGTMTADALIVTENIGWGIYSESGNVYIIDNQGDLFNPVWDNGKGGVSAQSGSFKGKFMDIDENGHSSTGDSEGYGIIAKHVVVNGLSVSDSRNDGIKAESISHTNILGKPRLASFRNGGHGLNIKGNITCEGLEVYKNDGWGAISENGSINIKNVNVRNFASENKIGGLSAVKGSVSCKWLNNTFNGELAKSAFEGHGIIAGRVILEELNNGYNLGDGIRAHSVSVSRGYSISGNKGYGIIGSKIQTSGVVLSSNNKGGIKLVRNVKRFNNLNKTVSSNEDGANYSINIENSTISDNQGIGIDVEYFENSLIQNNNILRNNGYDLFSSEKTIQANNNWWGQSALPSDQINSLVAVDNWLTDSLSLFIFSESDSYIVPDGMSDSILFSIVNITNLEDSLKINITDSLGWMEDMNYDIGISDSTRGRGNIYFSVPNGEVEQNKITITAISVNSGREVKKDLFVTSYAPVYSNLKILQDSLTIGLGDTISFDVVRIDQNGKESEFSSAWSSSNGSIDNTGMFVSDSTIGVVEIVSEDLESGLSRTSYLYVTDEEQMLSKIRISPSVVNIKAGEVFEFTVNGSNQFGFPLEFEGLWQATGGTIDINGLFIAGETLGNYQVSVSDSSGDIFSSAVINILVGLEADNNNFPNRISLSQNYPNPFNPATKIQYGIPVAALSTSTSLSINSVEGQNVTIKIYDILGREITTLVNEKQKPGNYEVEFDGSELTSGIYFYRLLAGDFVETRKMILLK